MQGRRLSNPRVLTLAVALFRRFVTWFDLSKNYCFAKSLAIVPPRMRRVNRNELKNESAQHARYSLLMGIHRGMQGDALHSRLYLHQALAIDPAFEAAKIALQAVCP